MSGELSAGTRIRGKAGVLAPDVPEVSIEGWTGTITEVTGKKSQRKYFVEWDQETIDQMPAAYMQACQEKQLYHVMSCLGPDDIEPIED